MGHIIGIDFGTTKTLVSWLNPQTKRAELVRLGQTGIDKIPTSIYIDENGEYLFGEEADAQMQFDAVRYKRNFKLQLGSISPCMIVKINGKNHRFLAKDLTAKFLEYVKNRCERDVFLGGKITGAVITIPVSFSPAQKQDLHDAAQRAGFQQIVLLPEPEAAGIAFENYNPTDKFNNMMVIDWGGGTVDFAIIGKDEYNNIHTLENSFYGDDNVGGEIFDELLWQYAAEKIAEADEEHPDPNDEPYEIINEMLKQVRAAKEILSSRSQTLLRFRGEHSNYSIDISQKEFEKIITPQINEVAEQLKKLLNKAADNYPDALLMIGGGSKIPCIQKILSAQSGLRCISWQYSHEAVALGAAIYSLHISDQVLDSSEKIIKKPKKCIICNEKILFSGSEQEKICSQCGATCYASKSEIYDFNDLLNDNYKIEDIQKAAEQGDIDAEFMLGVMHSYAIHISLNPQEGMKWLKKASDAGHIYATFEYACNLYEGNGVMKNKAEAEKIFATIVPNLKIGLKYDNSFCQYAYGYLYKFGITVEKNINTALQYFEKAISQNNFLALSVIDEEGYSGQNEIYLTALEKAIKYGWGRCNLSLALYYQNKNDIDEYIFYLKKAEKVGFYHASVLLCLYYFSKNQDKWQEYLNSDIVKKLQQDADNNNEYMLFFLAFLYENGFGVPLDTKKAFDLYKKSAEQGSAEGLVKIAEFYLFGDAVEKDEDLAFSILNFPILDNNADAFFLLALCYEFGWGTSIDLKESIKFLNKAAQKGNVEAMKKMGENYLYGNSIIEKNIYLGIKLLQKIEDAEAFYLLGKFYLEQNDYDKALEYLNKAAEMESSDAILALADCYNGGASLPENPYKAFNLYEQAKGLGNIQAMYKLGLCYLTGYGTPYSMEKAKENLLLAVDNGYIDAIKTLFAYGILYSEKEIKLYKDLLNYLHSMASYLKKFYVTPNIPHEKLQNAINCYAYDVEPNSILALYDDTFWGVADAGMLICCTGIYAHNVYAEERIVIKWEEIESVKKVGDLIINNSSIGVGLAGKAYLFPKIIRDIKDTIDNHFNCIDTDIYKASSQQNTRLNEDAPKNSNSSKISISPDRICWRCNGTGVKTSHGGAGETCHVCGGTGELFK